MDIRKHVFLLVALVYISFLVFPMLIDLIPLPVGTINILTFLLLFLLNPKVFFNRFSFWTLLYILVLAIYTFIGKQLPTMGIGDYESRRIMIIEAANILPVVAIYQHLAYYNDNKLYNVICNISLILIFLSLLYVIPLVLNDAYLLRKNEIRGEHHIFGVPSYALTHAYMLIVVSLMYGIRQQKGSKKAWLIIVLIFVSFIIYYSYITTTFLITLLAIIVCLLYSENNNKRITRISLLSFIIVLSYASGLLELLLNEMVALFTGTASQNKMIELRAMILGYDVQGGVFDKRSNLHDISWAAFGRNIFIGSIPVGGHSTLIDRLGGLGLVGFLPFAMMMACQVLKFRKTLYTKQSKFFYLVSVLVVLVYQYQKGLFGPEGWLFFFVLIPCYIRQFQFLQLQKESES